MAEMASDDVARLIRVTGRVQGVGFRPFVYRQAAAHALKGWVKNGAGDVAIHVEGKSDAISRFVAALTDAAPPLARARVVGSAPVPVEAMATFRIVASTAGEVDIHLPPDQFCCADCLAEMGNPATRRHRYPFTNCTQCGPRYTIITALPYDRVNTGMAGFALCADCRAEYEDPRDRRFHAEPLACPTCGPTLTFHDKDGEANGEAALAATVAALREGAIVAVKGVGGYHLMCDATNDMAVATLRTRKHRPHKPLAVMFPLAGADGLAAARRYVEPDADECAALSDPARPIVLVRKRRLSPLSEAIAPGLSEIGAFLPYSPLHALLLDTFGGPLVATSGNIGGEPVITDNGDSERRLPTIADAFLHHDRPIARPADDSVVRMIAGRARPIRLGRGIAPLEIDLPFELATPTLAVGGHLKTTVALGWGRRAVISPHIGDLDSPKSRDVFEQMIADLQALYGVRARRIACDFHPGYASTRWAKATGLPLAQVQHHVAHASALAAEHPEIDTWLTFTWDGVGLGDDGALWGGEGFAGAPGRWQRVASIRPFRVTGGDTVGRQPWRSASALMAETERPWTPRAGDAALLAALRDHDLATATTTSVGRLFDAAAALLLGIETTSFEGQGPMLLESAAGKTGDPVALPLNTDGDGILRFDWAPLLDLLSDGSREIAPRAYAFHASIADALAAQALTLRKIAPFAAVGLTGGVFQNRMLAEMAIARLAESGIAAFLPEVAPANDGGLAFGQLVEAAAAP